MSQARIVDWGMMDYVLLGKGDLRRSINAHVRIKIGGVSHLSFTFLRVFISQTNHLSIEGRMTVVRMVRREQSEGNMEIMKAKELGKEDQRKLFAEKMGAVYKYFD